MTNAMVYARISSDRTGQGLGVERQEADARALAAARGWTVVEVAVDNDISAAGGKTRPGFERVLEALDKRQVDVVVAWALDRLTRNRRDTVRLVEAAQAAEATVALVRGSDLDMSTPAGRLTADLLAAVARSEIETKADRQRRAHQQAVEAGRWDGGRRAFGYESDGVTIREDEAQAVRDGYEWILAGASLGEVARRWNARGFATPQKRRDGSPSSWNGGNVGQAMRKPRYAGLMGDRRQIVGEAQWPAIVDAETWHAAQAVMRDPKRRPSKGDRKLLTGLALCGVCGAPVWAGGGAPGRGVYRCRAGAHVSRMRAPIDECVVGVTLERLRRPDVLALIAPKRPDEGPTYADLARQHEELRARLDPLADAYATGDLTLSQLRVATDRIKEQLQAVEDRMAPQHNGGAAVREVASAEDVEAAWNAQSIDVQRQIVDTLMTIHLDPPGRGKRDLRFESVRIIWK